MKKNLIALACLFIAAAHVCFAQSAFPDEVKESIRRRIDNGINPGIVIGFIDINGVQYYSAGLKSLDGNDPVNEHSVFEIGSVSKTFTGVLLADNVMRGEMKLDDPLQKYLPQEITAPSRNGVSIKLVHLANHTSSLPRMPDNFNPANPANPFVDYSEKQMFNFLMEYKPARNIGSQYEYSNYAVGLLGHVMAAKRGITYEKLMLELIAEPLAMNDTRIALTPEMKKNLAIGHHEGVAVENWDIITLAGAGGIRSTVSDIIKYLSANMGIVKNDLYPAMELSHTNSRERGSTPMVGLGWHIMTSGDDEIIWHNGGTGGYRSYIGFIRGKNKGVVILTNSSESVDDIGIHLLDPTVPLRKILPSVAMPLRDEIDAHGIEAGLKMYHNLKRTQAGNYDFSEAQLKRLGKKYMEKSEAEKAIAVLSLNAEAYPESSGCHYQLAEAYQRLGNKEQAIDSYKRSLALNPGNEAAVTRLKELGAGTEEMTTAIVIEDAVLDSYLGKYELAPGFIVTISRDGSQLSAQATNQPQFQIFPKSFNVFYFKVVEAQLTFNQNGEGVIESVTLNQGGKTIIGKKLP